MLLDFQRNCSYRPTAKPDGSSQSGEAEWGEPISYVLSEFNEWLEQWQKDSKADELMIWTQGTDFDIAVLRNAYRVVFGDEKSIPWHFRNVRDARTYFLEIASVFEPDVEDPYSLIETKGTVHNALADCDWSIKAVQWAYEQYTKVSFLLTDKIHRNERIVEEKWERLKDNIDKGEVVIWEAKKPLVDEIRADVKYVLPAGAKVVLRKVTHKGSGYTNDVGYVFEKYEFPLRGFVLREDKVKEYFQPFRALSKEEKAAYDSK